jgi:hypothetical protein
MLILTLRKHKAFQPSRKDRRIVQRAIREFILVRKKKKPTEARFFFYHLT